MTYHGAILETTSSSSSSKGNAAAALTASKLIEMLADLESALELSSPLSPRKFQSTSPSPDFESSNSIPKRFDGFASGESNRDGLHQLLQSYRALYFDFYYITDELVWYGVRGNAVRHSLMLADLAYGVVFNHEVFRVFLTPAANSTSDASSPLDGSGSGNLAFPRLLLPWIRQLGHFLSFFPENQETTLPLRQLYDQLRKFELS